MSEEEDEVPPSEKLKQKRYCGLKPFKKGTSGNPSGRSKQHTERVAEVRIHAYELPVLAISTNSTRSAKRCANASQADSFTPRTTFSPIKSPSIGIPWRWSTSAASLARREFAAVEAHSAAKARAQRAADVAARAEALMKEAEAELARLERTAVQAAHTAAKAAKLAAAMRAGGTPLSTCHKNPRGGRNV
jgi:hypothetical protein